MDKVIILGGNIPHKTLICKLKERGYYTVLIDYLETPPAKEVADVHIQESILDKDKVLDIARSINPRFVINLCVDRGMVTAAYVSEKLGLPILVNLQAAVNATDKCRMKQIFIKNGIPTSKFYTVNKETDVMRQGIEFPVVVKPADASGSIGVKRINNPDELINYLPVAFDISRSGEVVVEEFVDGLEVSIDCFVCQGKIDILLVRQKLKKHDDQNLSYPLGSVILNEFPHNSKVNIEKQAKNIVEAFGLENTPFFMQAFIDRNGNLSMIEFGARIGGGMSFQIIKSTTGFDIMDAAIDCYEGKRPSVIFHKPEYVFSTNYIFTNQGIFDRIEGYEKLLNIGKVENFVVLAQKGHLSDGAIASRNKTGYFFIKADCVSQLFKKTLEIVDEIEVYDQDGKPIMKKDIFKDVLNKVLTYYVD